MLRYLAYGSKDFTFAPVMVMSRFNWEFYANLDGRLRPTDGRKDGALFSKTPMLWLYPPDHPHGWESQGEVERVVFHFSSVPDVIREACSERGFLSVVLQPPDVAQLRELGHALETHYRSPTPASLLLFDRALIDLSLLFLRGKDFGAALPLETVAVERVERVIEWYLSHLHERPTLEALAEVVHVSPAHLRRQFQVVYGKSPHLVLTHLRLEKAAQLLANTGDTLDVIARRCGFNSASDLCRVFRRRFKAYPNEWRTQVAGTEKPSEQIERLIARVDPEAAALSAQRREKSPGKRTLQGRSRVGTRVSG